MKYRHLLLLLILFALMTSGCAIKRPTIAHTHIGHSLTAWIDTPEKDGLFIVAEKMARQTADAAQAALNDEQTLQQIQHHIARAVASADAHRPDGANTRNQSAKGHQPAVATASNSAKQSADRHAKAYGTKQALTGAIGHMSYAATSDDASDNVRRFASIFEQYAQIVLDRCDLIAILGNDVLTTKSPTEARLLAQEVKRLAQANLYGEDADGDGTIGGTPAEYGLKQLRSEIEQMIDREDPPYSPVNRWYLFNLVRLPDGRWIFRNRFEDKDDAYSNTGGNGGGGGY